MDSLMQDIESRQQVLDLKHYADIYVKHKDRLFPLMEEAVGEPLPPDLSHAEAIELYGDLLSRPVFADKVDDLQGGYNNALDPITAIAEGIGSIADTVGGIVGRKQQKELMAQQQEMEEQRFFQNLVLRSQKDNDTGKILLITGISAAVVGLTIFLIVKARK